MRILFLHLSDLHIKDSSKVDTVKIDKVIQSVLKYRNIIDEVVIVLSGDVAWSGGINEYKVACRLIHILRKRIGNELNKSINIKIVPGNHDIIMSKLNRNSSDIIDYFKNNTAKEMYYNELKSMSAFLRFANHYKCFISNKVCDKGIIDFSEKYGCRIQFNLINTAPFSTLKADSKELHFLPDNELSSLYRDDSSDICITIMHHSTEWFYWEKKEELENIIYHHSDFVFQGHEHILHSSTINMDNKINIIIFKGGEFSVDDSMASQYSIIVFDTETREVNEDKYTWDYKTPIFVSEPIFKNKKVLVKSSSFQINEEFLVDFNKDKLGFCESFTDYYVFPKLYYSYTRESKYKLDIDESYFFNILKNKKIIEIRAGKSAGKTAFLKYIFNVCQEYGFISLYIGAEEYTSFKVDTIVERLFNDQYSKYDLERFLQTSNEKKILLIDDADKLANNKLLNIIFEKIFEHVDHIIYSSDNSFNLNIIEAAKEEIDKDNVLQLNLAVFYKEKRKQLVTNICKTAKLNDSDTEIIINSIDNLVQHQSGLFSLSPEFIIVYLKYFMSFDHQKSKQDDVFSKVFETNINTAIISATSKSTVK